MTGAPDSETHTISEPIYWFLRGAFERFTRETGIEVDIDSQAEARIEGACLLELFLTLEPIAADVRGSSDKYLQEVGLTKERDQTILHKTPLKEGLAMIEGLMKHANAAYNGGSALKIGVATEKS